MTREAAVLAVVGAQYGSEGKGVIVNRIAHRYDVHVRTGGPNAGHSFIHGGLKYKQQVLPCGWTNPDAMLVIGAGAMIDLPQLLAEVETASKIDGNIRERILIDQNAWVVTDWDRRDEDKDNIVSRIGSTGHGVGAARTRQIRRDAGDDQRVTKNLKFLRSADLMWGDTSVYVNERIDRGEHVLLEGTQGSGLSLMHGYWPHCTSSDTGSATLAAMAGIAPHLVRTLLVARTFPIRVHGNSGPLANEIDWHVISNRVGKPTEEKTTVTKKVRRIGKWDDKLFRRAVIRERPAAVALTFMDYYSPSCEGSTDFGDLDEAARNLIGDVEFAAGAPVSYVGTGGPTWSVIER